MTSCKHQYTKKVIGWLWGYSAQRHGLDHMTFQCFALRHASSWKCWFQYIWACAGLQINVCNWKYCFLFLNWNLCCGHSKEPSRWDGSFEHPTHLLKLLVKKKITILRSKSLLNWSYDAHLAGWIQYISCSKLIIKKKSIKKYEI